MFDAVLTYLWTAMIVVCPAVCRAGVAPCAHNDGATQHSDCAGHEDGHGKHSDHEKSPVPRRCGHCLCGGAVVNSLRPIQVLNDALSCISPWTTADSLDVQAVLVRGHDESFADHLLPGSGRALRIRIESFLI